MASWLRTLDAPQVEALSTADVHGLLPEPARVHVHQQTLDSRTYGISFLLRFLATSSYHADCKALVQLHMQCRIGCRLSRPSNQGMSHEQLEVICGLLLGLT